MDGPTLDDECAMNGFLVIQKLGKLLCFVVCLADNCKAGRLLFCIIYWILSANNFLLLDKN